MPTIYDLSTNQQAIELLPPDKRNTVSIAWLQTLLKSTVQWLRDALIGDYRSGSSYPTYTSATYNRNNKVIYQKGVYVSLVDGNTNVPTGAGWYKVCDNFIGVEERVLYNGQTIVLEYALNKWFGTTFRQPGGSHSDIYLSNNAKPLPIFIIGGNQTMSSAIYANNSTEYILNSGSFTAGFINLNINIPTAVYNALDSNPLNRDNIIRAFADKYVNAGILYQIITY